MTEPTDKKLRELIGYQLRRTTGAAMPEITKLLEPYGLRRSTFSALTIIEEFPRINQSQLSEALSIEPPNLVAIINELENAGLVERRPTPNDRRTYALQITKSGVSLLVKAQCTLKVYETNLTAGLTEAEISTLHRILGLIEKNAQNNQSNKEEHSDEFKVSQT